MEGGREGGRGSQGGQRARERENSHQSLSRSEHAHIWGSSAALSCDSRERELPVVVDTQKQKETERVELLQTIQHQCERSCSLCYTPPPAQLLCTVTVQRGETLLQQDGNAVKPPAHVSFTGFI